jgi:hypothetical protein
MGRSKIINRVAITALLLVFFGGLIACSSNQTRLYERWHDTTYSGGKLNKVLVLGIFKDDIQRRAFEANFVSAVEAGGKQAVAGYTLMPEKDDFDSKEDILAAVAKVGADAVLITSFKGVIEKQRDVAPRVDYVQTNRGFYGRGYGGYGGYYGATYDTIYRPGYTITDTIVQLDTRVYAVENEKLIWAGKTKSVNASSAKEITQELVGLVVDDMKKSGLIK